MTNIKDTLTTIAGIVGGIGSILVGLSTELAKVGIPIPIWLQIAGGVCTAIAVVIIGYFNGKNADGSTKVL